MLPCFSPHRLIDSWTKTYFEMHLAQMRAEIARICLVLFHLILKCSKSLSHISDFFLCWTRKWRNFPFFLPNIRKKSRYFYSTIFMSCRESGKALNLNEACMTKLLWYKIISKRKTSIFSIRMLFCWRWQIWQMSLSCQSTFLFPY